MSKNRKDVCRRICAKSIRSILEPYSRYLSSRGYSSRTCHVYACAVEHFGRWLGRRHVNWFRVENFLDQHLPTCRCPRMIRDRRPNRAALRRLLEMLGQDWTQTTFPQGYAGDLLRRYQEHLATVRGLAAVTIQVHLKFTAGMLSRLGVRRESQFTRWTPELIARYVSQEGRHTRSRGRNATWCARSLLRFLLQEGLIQRDLAAAVPSFARWRLASLPRALGKMEINRLIRAANLGTSIGRRDHAIVLCMSELGLRASDVANLELDSIDFTAGVLQLRQRKEREASVLPMTRRLCSALNAYLRRGRPQCASSAVFIRHHAPLGKPLTPVGICQVVLRLASRAGLRDRVGGTHVLRQSLASRMLSAGATLKQIADFLGHKSLDTTSLYAKVDLATLSRVALPWPGRKEVSP
ncbi:MAG: tyrosine-type recombinase/integrase [Planctomycetes bacterium]|nr:tyrosine-type recombinase/integrase [Planctomycetota bacterium]